MGALYVLRMGSLALQRYRGFGAQGFDLGIFDQALWLISQNRVPFVTVRGIHALGDHFTLCLYPLSLLYRAGFGVEGLLVFQVTALAVGAVPVFRLVARRTKCAGAAPLLAGAYLLHPALERMNLFDFHPVALATPAVLWALDAADAQRPVALFLVSLVALACKEEVALAVAGVALFTWWRGNRGLGLSLLGLAPAWLLCALRLMKVPAGARDQQYLQLYEHLGGSVSAIATTMVFHPAVIAHYLVSWGALGYLLLLWVPLAMLPACHPRMLLLSLPLYLMNILSVRIQMRLIDFQYNALLIPFMMAACALRLRSLRPETARPALIALLVCTSTVALAASPALNPWFGAQWGPASYAQTVLAQIPPRGSLSATDTLVPHLTHRPDVYLFPNPFERVAWGASRTALREQLGVLPPRIDRATFHRRMQASGVDFIAIRLWDCSFPPGTARFNESVRYALSCRSYGIVARAGGVVLLRRGADHYGGLRTIGAAAKRSTPDALVERTALSKLTGI